MGASFLAGSADFGRTGLGGLAEFAGTGTFAISLSSGALSCPMVTQTANPAATAVSAATAINAVGFDFDFFPRPFAAIVELRAIGVSKTSASPASEGVGKGWAVEMAAGRSFCRSNWSYAVFFSGLSRQILAVATSLSSFCDSAEC